MPPTRHPLEPAATAPTRRLAPRRGRRARLVALAIVASLVAIGAVACSPKANPIGNTDVFRRDTAGRVIVEGWAFDPDLPGPVTIEVRQGSTVLASQTTGTPLRNDVASAYPGQTGNAVGFSLSTAPITRSSQPICTWALNRGIGSGDKQLKCQTYDQPSTFALVGDSLGVGVESPLRTKFVAAYPGASLVSRVEGSTPLSYAVTGINQYKANKDVIVVSSGANNLLSTTIASDLRTAMANTSGAACVVWPTISERIYQNPANPPGYGTPAQWAAGARAFNNALRAEAARLTANGGHVFVADWAPVVTATAGYTGTDGLHHTGSGNTAFATILANTVADNC